LCSFSDLPLLPTAGAWNRCACGQDGLLRLAGFFPLRTRRALSNLFCPRSPRLLRCFPPLLILGHSCKQRKRATRASRYGGRRTSWTTLVRSPALRRRRRRDVLRCAMWTTSWNQAKRCAFTHRHCTATPRITRRRVRCKTNGRQRQRRRRRCRALLFNTAFCAARHASSPDYACRACHLRQACFSGAGSRGRRQASAFVSETVTRVRLRYYPMPICLPALLPCTKAYVQPSACRTLSPLPAPLPSWLGVC